MLCGDSPPCDELGRSTGSTGLLKSYKLVWLVKDNNLIAWSLLRVGSLLWEERTCCGWAGLALEPAGSWYSQQPLAHRALVEVSFVIWAAEGLLGGGTGKLPAAQKGPNFPAFVLKSTEEGNQCRLPARSWELFVHTESFLGVLQALSSTSLLTQTTLLLPIPGHTHHTWHRLRPEPCSCLPRQKRQWESSKPIARTISHGERNIYLGNTFNLHTAVNFHPLQQRTARYKVSQEQKIQPWKCRGMQEWTGQSDWRGMHVQEKHRKAEPSQEAEQ